MPAKGPQGRVAGMTGSGHHSSLSITVCPGYARNNGFCVMALVPLTSKLDRLPNPWYKAAVTITLYTPPNAYTAGDPILGRMGSLCPRAIFFGPSPSANPVGVEEGHPILDWVPFFFMQGRLTGWVEHTRQARRGGAK